MPFARRNRDSSFSRSYCHEDYDPNGDPTYIFPPLANNEGFCNDGTVYGSSVIGTFPTNPPRRICLEIYVHVPPLSYAWPSVRGSTGSERGVLFWPPCFEANADEMSGRSKPSRDGAPTFG